MSSGAGCSTKQPLAGLLNSIVDEDFLIYLMLGDLDKRVEAVVGCPGFVAVG